MSGKRFAIAAFAKCMQPNEKPFSLEPISKSLSPENAVMPAKAGIRRGAGRLDSSLRGNEEKRLTG